MYNKDGNEVLNNYLNNFVDADTHKLDYRKLIDDVMEFDYRVQQFNDDEFAPKSHGSFRSGLEDALDAREQRNIYNDDYVVLDQKKVPQNMIEHIETRTVKINRRLKKLYPNQKDLKEKIDNEIKSDANGNITVD